MFVDGPCKQYKSKLVFFTSEKHLQKWFLFDLIY